MSPIKNQLRYRYANTQPRTRSNERPTRRRRSRLETLEARTLLAAELNFDLLDVGSYGGRQDVSGVAASEDAGASLRLSGNGWKQVELPYEVTPNTVLEFDFDAAEEGEIHGIGFDDNLRLSSRRIFQLQGTQRWGLQSFRRTGGDVSGPMRFRIPVGEFYTGDFEYLVFANDHDVSDPTAQSLFSNVRVYEDVVLPEPQDDVYTVTAGRATVLDVLANDSEDLDEDEELTLVAVSEGSSGGSLSLDANRIQYQSADGFVGTETFSYTVENSAGASATATGVITVEAPDPLEPGVVLQLGGDLRFNGDREGHVVVEHRPELALAQGTYSLSFVADDVDGSNALFSKDASGYQDGGHLTAFVRDGRVKVRFQSDSRDRWVSTPKDSIVAGEEYHVAVTFGPDGLWLYLDGAMQDWETQFDQTMELNPEGLLIGANGWSSTPENPDSARDHFEGTISDFTVFDSQKTAAEVRLLAGLQPPVDPTEPFVEGGVLYGTLDGETLDLNLHPDAEAAFGNYGDDLLIGTNSGVVLNGGHGLDRLEGGDGNDLLNSFSDGREPRIYQQYDPAEDDPNGDIDLVSRTHFAGQPIEADDVLRGGGGADIFHFRALVNAKRDIILKHVRDDRTIDWHGVTGENRYVHDHWVDRFGNEIIEDFSREEGDHIEIVGHTVDVERVEHVDLNGDGVIESTVIYVQSNQGNAGAHNKDKLGTITALNALLTQADYTVNAAPAYGIVATIDELDEALDYRVGTPIVGDVRYDTPLPTPTVVSASAPAGSVLHLPGDLPLSGEDDDHLTVRHTPALALAEGTYSLSFVADDVDGSNALFSKDASGYQDGGHLTAFVRDGRVKVRFQSDSRDRWVYTSEDSIVAGQEYHLAVTFGPDGLWLYLDGAMQDWETQFDQTMELNPEDLLIGANGWSSTPENPDSARDHFEGTISDFTIFDSQKTAAEVRLLAGLQPPVDPAAPFVEGGVLYGTLDGDTLDLNLHPDAEAAFGNYGDDLLIGTNSGVVLNGGHGIDRLEGGDGNDVLNSFSDGREPRIYQQYDPAEDDPNGDIDPVSRTHFAGQPIEADDVLRGGGGADIFHFRALVNAKRDIILKHVRDDRTIDWHGVTGENRYVHDHWVDRFGNEIIEDFSREEGDHIEIVGHTVDVERVEHVDLNGDGVIESTVIYVQSNQGNAGAHNKDKLGTITALNALLTQADYTVNAAPAYGIVATIDELDEALDYRVGTPIVGDVRYDTPLPTPTVVSVAAPAGSVLHLPGDLPLSGEDDDHITIRHTPALALAEGTYSLSFVADDVDGSNALFSKDASGFQDGGHLTAFVRDGRVKVRFQSDSRDRWVYTPEDSIVAGQEYHLAVTFGPDGLWLYLNGAMQDWETQFDQTMELNPEDLLIGANGWSSTPENPDSARDHFEGTISDFTVFDSQKTRAEVRLLAGLQPPVDPAAPFVKGGVLYGTLDGETLDLNLHPDAEAAFGNYGDDLLIGTNSGVVLNGGHGLDRLEGGDGNDVLNSFSDGREPRIYQQYDPAEDDPNGDIDPVSRTHFAGQPIESDDVLRGGGGADIFHFRALVNAKRDIILKHVRDDRTIDWHGVTGENRYVHDHWVDRFGNEIIEDFSREEGDHIEIVGHTVDVERVEHVDLNGDGVIESTVIYVQSNQGNAGAHNKDKLGTITALNALLTQADYTVNAAPAYGIVATIDELDEALDYRVGTPIVGDVRYDTPLSLPPIDPVVGPEGSVVHLGESLAFSGKRDDHIEVAHSPRLALAEGTVAMHFTADDVGRRRALFSKDASGYENGGHVTAFVQRGRVKVRFQSDSRSVWLTTSPGSIVAGQEHHLAFAFGPRGASLYLDGELVDAEAEFVQGMEQNGNSLLIGANGWARTAENPDWSSDQFAGSISGFTVYESQLSESEVKEIANPGLPSEVGSDFLSDEDREEASDAVFSEIGVQVG